MKKSQSFSKTHSTLGNWIVPFLFTFCGCVFNQQAVAQLPHQRNAQVAAAQPIQQESLAPVSLAVGDPRVKMLRKTPIAFQPIPLKDNTGKAIPANQMLTLKNGRQMTAQQYVAELNEFERKLNAEGYSLRKKESPTTSETVNDETVLNTQATANRQSVAAFRREADLRVFMTPAKQVGTVTLKPIDEYTPAERQRIDGLDFEAVGKDFRSVVTKRTAATTTAATLAVPRPLKTVNETSVKDFNFGRNGAALG